ncbi:DNA-3-methyladenine glycosylase II [Chthoniobacter flavus Ellin428]|uniref:DNA-3-methyladenine glycosylase II n=1 Tax=Chthoniobacter flavus Ellin428 TaxID=497964 RepID=B4CYJ1_9BACT|nr:DNA-3-methyladenine glycosylase [Chthoniobacter flavus]EDY20532.1 DNA-3-methyladenine glycosylase II [Chthoniobacter flavus Ellin428]TCO89954.1 DNA-3-methyladenine glycosylase II [Chthoniobacter flavus]
MTPEAHEYLTKRCKVMRRLIRTHGPCTLQPEKDHSPFRALVRAVAHQQLNGTAAETILRRFCALFPGKKFPTAKDLASVTDEALRGSGFSWAKIAALRDIAAKTLDGTIPSTRAIQKMNDAEIIERLVQVRGVGRWTVEMMLIFKLGRPDVFPADDFGIRDGFRVAYGLDEMPKPKEILAHAERWRPYATTAAWYFWRAANAAKDKKAIKGVNA